MYCQWNLKNLKVCSMTVQNHFLSSFLNFPIVVFYFAVIQIHLFVHFEVVIRLEGIMSLVSELIFTYFILPAMEAITVPGEKLP